MNIMSNTNGLLSGRDVCYTGYVDSNIYLRKGEPIAIPSPLTIVSADGTKDCTIVETNAGICQLGNDFGDIEVIVGTNSDLILETNPANSGNINGLIINRLLPTAKSGSVKLNGNGDLVVAGDNAVTIVPAGGSFNVVTDNSTALVPATETTGDCALSLRNGSACVKPTRFTIYNSSLSTGGLNVGNLQTYGYTGAGLGVSRMCLDIDPEGDAVVLGDSSVVGGCNVGVNGTLGAGRVYDTVYNTLPGAQYLTASGQTSSKTAAFDTMPSPNVFQNVSGSFSFPASRTGLYQLEINAVPSTGSGELLINSNPISGIADGNALLTGGGILAYIVDNSVAPPVNILSTYTSISFQQMKDIQTLSAANGRVIVSNSFPMTAGQNIEMVWSILGGASITRGLLTISVIAL